MLTMATQDPLQAHQSHTNHYMKTEAPDPGYDYRLGLSTGMEHGHYPPPHHAQYMHGHAFSQVEHMAMANRLPHYSLDTLHHDSHPQHNHHHLGPPPSSHHHAHHHNLDGSHNGGGTPGGGGTPFSHTHESHLYHHMGVPSQSSYMDHSINHAHNGGGHHHINGPSDMDLEKTYGKNASNENHYSTLMPSSHPGGVYKNESAEDPYSFVDEDPMLGHGSHDPGLHNDANKNRGMAVALPEPGMPNSLNPGPKKRGRKKKVDLENPESADPSQENAAGQVGGKRKYTKSEHYKQRRRHDRFNGMSEEEVKSRTLPDHLIPNLDIVIIGINPGLFAAYKGHHYAGPGNHFWKCLYLAGLVPEPMTADDDFKMVHYGIGFTNMVNRATKGSADLTRKEIREGGRLLLEKLQQFRPKIAVFNGKGIYEVYSGKKDFTFGRQPEFIDGTNTYIWVMPSSSARCAQLPRAMDKVPFYAALKKFRDYLNGLIPEIDDSEVVFNDPRIRNADDGSRLDNLKDDQQLSPENFPPALQPGALGAAPAPLNGLPALPAAAAPVVPVDPNQPPKKKRGRPKKVRPEDGGPLPDGPPALAPAAAPQLPPATQRASSASLAPPILGPDGNPLKKKRGRPKKIRVDDSNKPEPTYVDRGTEQSSNSSSSSLSEATGLHNSGHVTPTASLTPTSSYPQPSSSGSAYASPAFLAQSSVRQSPTRPHSLPHTYHPSPLALYNQSPSPAQQQPPSVSNQSYDLGSTSDLGRSASEAGTRSADPTLTSPTQPSPLDPPDFELPNSLPPPNELAVPTGSASSSSHHSPHESDPSSAHEQPPTLNLAAGSYYSSNPPGPPTPHPLPAGTPQQSQPPHPPQSLSRNAYNSPVAKATTNQDIATKSLSGLESLVDQIPNLADHHPDGSPALGQPPTNFSPNPNRGPLAAHYQTSTPFGAYASPGYPNVPTSAPPSSTYSTYPNTGSSTSYGSYGSPYEHESSFSVPNFGSSFSPLGGPMSTASGMFASSSMGSASLGMAGLPGMPPSTTLGYPYSQYPGPVPASAYSSWNPPGAGLHVPPANYGYPAAYGQPPYAPQATGYLNNSVLDRFKHERMDMGFGGY